MLHRRSIVTPAPAPAPILGKLKFRRVWNRGDDKAKTDNQRPHWYVDAHSPEGACNDMARRTRRKADTFESERD